MKINILDYITQLISVTSIIISVLGYLNSKKKNTIDQQPYFDIDNSRMYITYNQNHQYTLSIPLINIGNGIAIGISTETENLHILYDTTMRGANTWINVTRNISMNDSIIKFEIVFFDLEDNKYRQDFELKINVTDNYINSNSNCIQTYRDNRIGNCYYFYLQERKIKRPIKLKIMNS